MAKGAVLNNKAEDDNDFDGLWGSQSYSNNGARMIRLAAAEGAQSRGGRSAGRTAGGCSMGSETTATASGNASQQPGSRLVGCGHLACSCTIVPILDGTSGTACCTITIVAEAKVT